MSRSAPRREALSGVLLLLPALGLVSLTVGAPLLRALLLSVSRYRLTEGIASERLCGPCNFEAVFDDPFLAVYVRNQAIFVLGTTLLPVLVALGLALLMNRPLRLRWLWRALLLVPWVMPPATIAVTWRWIYDQEWGLANEYLRLAGLTDTGLGFLTSPELVWPSILLTATWMWYPYNYVVLLAALQSIPAEIYEAARIDGSSAWSEFRFITLPFIRPVLALLVTLGLIWSSNDFTTIFLLTQGGPGVESTTIPPLMYRTTFRFYDIGRGAAIGVLLMLGSLVFVALYLRRARTDIG